LCIFVLHSVLELNGKIKNNLRTKKIEINFQNQILVKSNAELDRFVYSASHDLRAPLSSMAGLIDLIHRDDSETDKYLAMIKDRIGVMDRFITEVIDYSRNARLGINNERILIKTMVDEVVSLLQFSIPPSIEVFNNVSPTVAVETDRSRLQVVISNLISNAVKYSDLRKTSPFIKVSAEITDTECRISVADNGIGIHKEHQVKIFDMFYRATERSKGSGLGLFIVKETLEKIAGQMEVASEYGVGSVFKIKLPIAPISSNSPQ
ncbi:MAG: sensor histidine kinase, partial [Flammeovirgaceae bacterium]